MAPRQEIQRNELSERGQGNLQRTPSYEMPRVPPAPQIPELSRKAKLISTAVLAVVALLSFFVIAEFAASPQTHSGTIQTLDEKKNTVMGLVGASSASSTAITLIPGDAGTPIAEKLVDLSSDFLVVVAAIYLEKYLLTIAGFITFKILVPVSCLLAIAAINLRESLMSLRLGMAQIAVKLFVFGIAMFLVVPVSVFVSGMIERTYEESINSTIATANQTTQQIEEAANGQQAGSAQEAGEGQEQSTDLLTTISQIPEAIAQLPENISIWIEEGQTALNGFVEALAVMIVTSCIIPLLVLVLFLWLAKVILGVRVELPMSFLYPRTLARHGRRIVRR